MKVIIIILYLASAVTVSTAQDTAYISKDKITAVFFKSPVKVLENNLSNIEIIQKESCLITLKAKSSDFKLVKLDVLAEGTNRIYHIPVQYSYGRAGRRIQVQENRSAIGILETPANDFDLIAHDLAFGKRKNTVDHQKTGGLKAWASKLSLTDNKIFFRLDICNHANLPYEVDFVRFYIRELKAVARMATHEQELVPVYSTLTQHTSILKSKEVAMIFAFNRFSLSNDQVLTIELYERNGNRHLYLQIKQRDLDTIQNLQPLSQQPENTVAANTL